MRIRQSRWTKADPFSMRCRDSSSHCHAQTWVASNEVAKKLGQIQDYKIFRSDLPQSGHFNMMLVVVYKNTADLAPNKARYEAFMKEWSEARNKETTEFAQKNYPEMREITGQYMMREVTMK